MCIHLESGCLMDIGVTHAWVGDTPLTRYGVCRRGWKWDPRAAGWKQRAVASFSMWEVGEWQISLGTHLDNGVVNVFGLDF